MLSLLRSMHRLVLPLLAPPKFAFDLSLCTYAHRRISSPRLSRDGNRLNPEFVAGRAQATSCRNFQGRSAILLAPYTQLTKKLRGCCASASKLIDCAPNMCGIPARSSSVPANRHRRRTMNSLFQAEEPSFRTAKRIGVVVAGLVLLGLAMWVGIAMALRVASGR